MSEAKKPLNGDHLQHTQALLEKEGLGAEWEIIVSNDNELQLDIDENLSSPPRFLELYAIFTEQHPVIGMSRSISRSGRGVHVQIHLSEPMRIVERIAWQLVLGSDPKREALALISVEKGWKNPLLLFERRQNA